MKRRGFTLIELLVVIAIIAILAAILFPVFAKARAKARQAACISNIKQIMLGVLMYADDFDDALPLCVRDAIGEPAPEGGWWNPDTIYWQQAITPYTKSKALVTCPDAVYGKSAPWVGSYGANISGNMFGLVVQGWGKNKPSYTLGAIAKPAEVYAIMDSGEYMFDWTCATNAYGYGPSFSSNHAYYIPGTGNYLTPLSSSNPMPEALTDWKSGRHAEGCVVGYADGHAKWVKGAQIVAENGQAQLSVNDSPFLPYRP